MEVLWYRRVGFIPIVDGRNQNARLRLAAACDRARRAAPTRVGVESMDNFFSRMKGQCAVEPGFHLSFKDPADFLEVITPARVRLLREISTEPVTLSALALVLARDPSAVRRDVALLESQSLVTTSKVSNSGHGKRTVVRRVATRIELAAVV